MKVKSESEVAQSYPTLSDLMDCSLPGYPIHGIFQVRVLECGASAFSDHLVYSVQMYWNACVFDSIVDFPGGSDGKESAYNAGGLSFDPWVR